jgi:hypothetical protein
MEVGYVLLLPYWGGSLKRLHRPNLFGFGCIGLKEKQGFQDLAGFHPVCPQRGPYEASEGIYPGHGHRKNWKASQNYSLTVPLEHLYDKVQKLGNIDR